MATENSVPDEAEGVSPASPLPELAPPPAPFPHLEEKPAQDSVIANPLALSLSEKRAITTESFQPYVWNVHSYVNEYIRFADAKAGAVSVISGTLLGLLYAGDLQKYLVRTSIGDWNIMGWLSCLAFFFLSLSIMFSVLAIRPRLKNNQPTGFIFWESILAFGSSNKLVENFMKESEQGLTEHLLSHLYTLSWISSRKYKWVNAGILAAVAGGITGALALFFK